MTKLYVAMYSRLMDLREREEGQTFAEYGVILAIVAVALIVTLGVFQGKLTSVFDAVGNKIGQ